MVGKVGGMGFEFDKEIAELSATLAILNNSLAQHEIDVRKAKAMGDWNYVSLLKPSVQNVIKSKQEIEDRLAILLAHKQ